MIFTHETGHSSAPEDRPAGPKRAGRFLLLQGLFLLYSVSGVLGKLAAGEAWPSPGFFWLYGLSLTILAVYAFLWQRALRLFPLTTAFAGKGAVTLWGIVWGAVFFRESLNPAKILAAALIAAGVALAGQADG
jgi:drug/metabolite transporter (DMT)-like permease